MKNLTKALLMMSAFLLYFLLPAQSKDYVDFVREAVLQTFENSENTLGVDIERRDTISQYGEIQNVPRTRLIKTFLFPVEGKAVFDYDEYLENVQEIPLRISYTGICDKSGSILWLADTAEWDFTPDAQRYHPMNKYFWAYGQKGPALDLKPNVLFDTDGNILIMEDKYSGLLASSVDNTVLVYGHKPLDPENKVFSIRYKNIENGQQWERYFRNEMPTLLKVHAQGDFILLREKDTLRCYNAEGTQVFARDLARNKQISVNTSTFRTFLLMDMNTKDVAILGAEMKDTLAFFTREEFSPETKQGISHYVAEGSDNYILSALIGPARYRLALIDAAQNIDAQSVLALSVRQTSAPFLIRYDALGQYVNIYSNKELIHEMKGRKDGTDRSVLPKSD